MPSRPLKCLNGGSFSNANPAAKPPLVPNSGSSKNGAFHWQENKIICMKIDLDPRRLPILALIKQRTTAASILNDGVGIRLHVTLVVQVYIRPVVLLLWRACGGIPLCLWQQPDTETRRLTWIQHDDAF